MCNYFLAINITLVINIYAINCIYLFCNLYTSFYTDNKCEDATNCSAAAAAAAAGTDAAFGEARKTRACCERLRVREANERLTTTPALRATRSDPSNMLQAHSEPGLMQPQQQQQPLFVYYLLSLCCQFLRDFSMKFGYKLSVHGRKSNL